MRFRLLVLMHTGLLTGVMLLTLLLMFKTSWTLAAGLAAALTVAQAWHLIRLVERSNENLNRFLTALKYEDYSFSFPDGPLGPSFADLKATLETMAERAAQHRLRLVSRQQYLHALIDNMDTAILTFDAAGKVDLTNRAARKLFKPGTLTQLEDLQRFSRDLARQLKAMVPGQRALVPIPERDMTLAVYASRLQVQERTITAVSLQNISGELEKRETEAWQNLIRVLTHEILNSMTPISSLAGTVSGMVNQAGGPDNEQGQDIIQAMKAIEKRSQGLVEMVEAYRGLALIPQPKFRLVPLAGLFTRIKDLMKPDLDRKGIHFDTELAPPSLKLSADANLVEQVLINLLLNAADAVAGVAQPHILLRGWLDERGRVTLSVEDNGCGLDKKSKDKIFTPFWSTKEKGSGIGLSFSRQVMRLHDGSITAESDDRGITTFHLSF